MTAVPFDRLSPGRVFALFLFGAVTVSIFDGFHTHSQTTAYARPVMLDAAWWVPLLFGASVGGGALMTLVTAILGTSVEMTLTSIGAFW